MTILNNEKKKKENLDNFGFGNEISKLSLIVIFCRTKIYKTFFKIITFCVNQNGYFSRPDRLSDEN